MSPAMRSRGKHAQLTRSHQYNLAAHSDPNSAVGAPRRDADPRRPIDETSLTQLSLLIVTELAVSVKIGGDATCGAARCRVLDDTVIVPVPTLTCFGVEQIGVIRAELGQRRVEFTVSDAGASERSLPNRHDEIAQTGGDHFEGQTSSNCTATTLPARTYATIDCDDADRQPRPLALVVGHRNRIVDATRLYARR